MRALALTAAGLALAAGGAAGCQQARSESWEPAAAAASAPVAPRPPPAPSAARAPGSVENLEATKDVLQQLGDAYYKATEKRSSVGPEPRSHVVGPLNIRLGVVRGAKAAADHYYAVGETGYSDDPVSRQDGPHVFDRLGPSGPWRHLGDTGGAVCPPKVPQKLLALWGIYNPESCQ